MLIRSDQPPSRQLVCRTGCQTDPYRKSAQECRHSAEMQMSALVS